VQQLPKFMQTLNDSMYKDLEKVAKQRGITVQELIRAVILPDWLSKDEHGRKH
jgi:predicted DNA-binding ribbon-helix-helix protein